MRPFKLVQSIARTALENAQVGTMFSSVQQGVYDDNSSHYTRDTFLRSFTSFKRAAYRSFGNGTFYVGLVVEVYEDYDYFVVGYDGSEAETGYSGDYDYIVPVLKVDFRGPRHVWRARPRVTVLPSSDWRTWEDSEQPAGRKWRRI